MNKLCSKNGTYLFLRIDPKRKVGDYYITGCSKVNPLGDTNFPTLVLKLKIIE